MPNKSAAYEYKLNCLSVVLTVATMAIGLLVLVGWIFNITFLVQIMEEAPPMSADTAIGLLLAGLGILSMARSPHPLPFISKLQKTRVSFYLAIIIFAFGIFLFFQSSFKYDLLLPGINSPMVGASLLLFGLSFYFLNRPQVSRPMTLTIVISLLIIFFFSNMIITQYMIELATTRKLRDDLGMAIHSAISLAMLALALFLGPLLGNVFTILRSETTGGQVARIFLPAVIFILPILQAVIWAGYKLELYSKSIGITLILLAPETFFALLVFYISVRLEKEEVKKSQAVRAHQALTIEFIEYKKRQEERARLSALVSSCGQPIISKDLDGYISSWNWAAEKAFGYSEKEAIGRNIDFLIPPEGRAEHDRLASELIEGKVISQQEIQLQRRDGTKIDVSLTASPIVDEEGQKFGYSLFMQDISELKQELERRSRTEKALEEANRAKDDFLAVLSHELRTPLGVIIGYAEYIQMLEPQSQEFFPAIKSIEKNARSLAQIVSDILEISQIIKGKLPLQIRVFKVKDVIISALSTVRFAAESKDILLHSYLDPYLNTIKGDSGRLQQAIWNLLTNAIKFTPRGGRVCLEAKEINSEIQISVTDSGKGMSKEVLNHLFDRFWQEDASKTREQGGLGLGLSLVKHFVEAHGGSVNAYSEGPGKGSTFTIHIPTEQNLSYDQEVGKDLRADQEKKAEIRELSKANSLGLNGLKILVIEDQRDTQIFLMRLLAHQGAFVVSSAGGGDALKILERERFDLIICDIGMPGMDGYTFLRQYRKEEIFRKKRKVPALALTAYASEKDKMESLAVGFDAHLAKPVEVKELIHTIQSLTSARRKRPIAL